MLFSAHSMGMPDTCTALEETRLQLHEQSPTEHSLKIFPWDISTGQEVLLLLPLCSRQFVLLLDENKFSFQKNPISATTFIEFTKFVFTRRKILRAGPSRTQCHSEQKTPPLHEVLNVWSDSMSSSLSSMFNPFLFVGWESSQSNTSWKPPHIMDKNQVKF